MPKTGPDNPKVAPHNAQAQVLFSELVMGVQP